MKQLNDPDSDTGKINCGGYKILPEVTTQLLALTHLEKLFHQTEYLQQTACPSSAHSLMSLQREGVDPPAPCGRTAVFFPSEEMQHYECINDFVA